VTTDSGDKAAPAWAPDGIGIAFAGNLQGPRRYVTTLGGSPVRLTRAREVQNSLLVPTWSPDGTKIAFGRVVDNGRHLRDERRRQRDRSPHDQRESWRTRLAPRHRGGLGAGISRARSARSPSASVSRVPCGLRVRPCLDVGRFDAEAGHDGADLLAMGVAVVERLHH
jgi:dipeptidyl aminopeptidase/acylaminoacyl peptidase